MSAEVHVWHRERKTKESTEYYILLVDEEQTVSYILKHNAQTNLMQVDPYIPLEHGSCIHEHCAHGNGACILDDPESIVSHDLFIAQKYFAALKRLLSLKKQVKQARVADKSARLRIQAETNSFWRGDLNWPN